MSSALFSACLAPCLEELLRDLRALDPTAKVLAYLDDIVIVVDGPHAVASCRTAERILDKFGLQIGMSKTKVWFTDTNVLTPAGLEACRVNSMTCLGNTLSYVTAAAEQVEGGGGADRVLVAARGSFPAVTSALAGFLDRMQALQSAGLRTQTAWTLFRTYVSGANNHVLRGCWADQAWCLDYDGRVVGFVEGLLGTSLDDSQRRQLFMPVALGGCGLPSASLRRSAALLGSWEQCFADVARANDASSASSLLTRAPLVAASLEEAVREIRALGVPRYNSDWSGCFNGERPKRQALLSQQVNKNCRRKLLADLGLEDKVDLRSAGGKGGAWLLPATRSDHMMPNDHFVVALRLRLRVPNAGHLRAPADQGSQCHHRYVGSGMRCQGLLDTRGHHSLTCNVGGAVDARHNHVRDWLFRLLSSWQVLGVLREQFVPAWDRVRRVRGQDIVERARLDVVFLDHHGRRCFVDIVIPTAASTCPEVIRARASKNGAAAARSEDAKRLRYPGPNLVPFAVEALGRPGSSALALMRSLAPPDPEERSVALGSAWQSLATTLQSANAELLLSAAS